MSEIRLIAAVGRSGQLGFDGLIPWHDREDLKWFRQQTMGHTVIIGRRTAETMGPLDGRTEYIWRGTPEPEKVIGILRDRERRKRMPERLIWIAGGAYTYTAFMPFVRRAVITLIDYDGPADVYMPPLWRAPQRTNGANVEMEGIEP